MNIPGSLPPAMTTTALPRVLILLRHWYDVILKMHTAGYSLRGDFCADNFVILNFDGSFPEVRLTGSIYLSTYDKDFGSMDYYFLASSVDRFFGVRGEVPPSHRGMAALHCQGCPRRGVRCEIPPCAHGAWTVVIPGAKPAFDRSQSTH
jgi:hypothetical protein